MDRFRDEYRKYLKLLSKDEMVDELLDSAVDRSYGAFTTDLLMNFLLEEEYLTEDEANRLPLEYFRQQIKDLQQRRRELRSSAPKMKKQSIKASGKKAQTKASSGKRTAKKASKSKKTSKASRARKSSKKGSSSSRKTSGKKSARKRPTKKR